MKIIKKILKMIFLLLLMLGVVLILVGYGRYRKVIQENPLFETIDEIMKQESFIPYNELDEDFVEAIVAIEDRRFFTRKGLDFKSIGRAFLVNLDSGDILEGGSTITQQVGKNLYFTNKPSITRKIAEIFLVYDLEKNYTKEEILAIYVNIIYYGDGYTGVGEASQGYFGKSPQDLSLYEATLLAGFPQSPSRYQLSNGYELINLRQRAIIATMLEQNIITREEADRVLELQP